MDRDSYFERVLEITKMQTKALEEENIDEFNILMDERQKLIDEINEVMDLPLNNKQEAIIKEVQLFDMKHKEVINKLLLQLQEEARKFRMQRNSVMSYEIGYNLFQEGGYYFDKKER